MVVDGCGCEGFMDIAATLISFAGRFGVGGGSFVLQFDPRTFCEVRDRIYE